MLHWKACGEKYLASLKIYDLVLKLRCHLFFFFFVFQGLILFLHFPPFLKAFCSHNLSSNKHCIFKSAFNVALKSLIAHYLNVSWEIVVEFRTTGKIGNPLYLVNLENCLEKRRGSDFNGLNGFFLLAFTWKISNKAFFCIDFPICLSFNPNWISKSFFILWSCFLRMLMIVSFTLPSRWFIFKITIKLQNIFNSLFHDLYCEQNYSLDTKFCHWIRFNLIMLCIPNVMIPIFYICIYKWSLPRLQPMHV